MDHSENDDDVLRKMAFDAGFAYIDQIKAPEPRCLKILSAEQARQYLIFPISIHANRHGQMTGRETLTCAVNDPYDFDTIDMLQNQSHMDVRVALATKKEILRAIAEHYG